MLGLSLTRTVRRLTVERDAAVADANALRAVIQDAIARIGSLTESVRIERNLREQAEQFAYGKPSELYKGTNHARRTAR